MSSETSNLKHKLSCITPIYKELGECIDKIIDHRGKTPKKLGGDWIDRGILAVSAKNVKNGKLVNNESARYVSHEMYIKWMKEDVKSGDCFLVSEGATLGECMYWDFNFPIVLSQRIFCIRVNKDVLYPKFFYAYMKTDSFQSEIIGRSTGSSVSGLRQTELLKMKIILLPMEVQKFIGDTLYELNKKIEINLQTSKILEQIAQTVFKSWFVDFAPVRDKIKGNELEGMDSDTAALFPEGFEESELGLVPKGWRWSNLDEISTVGIGKTPPRKEPQWFSESAEDVRWVSIRDMGIVETYISQTSEYLTAESIDRFNVRLVPDNTVLLSFKMTIGRVALTDGELTTNEAIAHFKLNDKSPLTSEFIYLHLKQFDYSTLSSTSSIADAVNSKTVKSIPILVPDHSVLKAFQDQVSAIFKRIKVIEQQSQTLASIRETLLSRLISGQLRLPDAEALIEEATA